MEALFGELKEKKTVTHGKATFELPILYHRDDSFMLYFTADCKKIKDVMPSDNLHPLVLPGNKSIVAIFAINYLNTAIGTYGEMGVALPAVYGKKITAFNGIFPALKESEYPGFGLVIMHMPVTSLVARDAGRGEWGYTKFISDMNFLITPEYFECRLSEKSEHIFDMRVKRKGFYLRDKKPLITYTVKDGNLIKT